MKFAPPTSHKSTRPFITRSSPLTSVSEPRVIFFPSETRSAVDWLYASHQ
jgi:hypothetical protein